MQRRNLVILLAILAILVVVGVPAFFLLQGNTTKTINGTPTPTVAALTLTATPSASPSASPSAKVDTGGQELTGEPGDTVVTLKWAAIAGAASYNVYRDGSTTPLNADPLADTQYIDVGLTNSRTYTYTVAPVDSAGKVGATLPPIKVTVGPK